MALKIILETLWGTVLCSTGKVFEPCGYCRGTKHPGIHFPSDFDDREESHDGKVFVTRCDVCDIYGSDTEAAEVIAAMTGWTVEKSYDIEYEPKADPKWYRPFFAVTLQQAEEAA